MVLSLVKSYRAEVSKSRTGQGLRQAQLPPLGDREGKRQLVRR